MSSRKSIDLTVNCPAETQVGNAIIARCDCGVSNLRKSGNGVVETVRMNYERVDGRTDVAKTLLARDYKGFGTGFDTQNGIVEWKNQESS